MAATIRAMAITNLLTVPQVRQPIVLTLAGNHSPKTLALITIKTIMEVATEVTVLAFMVALSLCIGAALVKSASR